MFTNSHPVDANMSIVEINGIFHRILQAKYCYNLGNGTIEQSSANTESTRTKLQQNVHK